jgi:hypothetical protein
MIIVNDKYTRNPLVILIKNENEGIIRLKIIGGYDRA